MANELNDSGATQATPDVPVPAAPAPSIDVWTRVKDHKIAQWTLAYAAAAYALLDGTKILSEAFDWPHWLLRAVAALLVLGLPLMVTLAWYHGHRALRRVSGAELTIITALLVVAGAVLWHFARAPQEPIVSKGAVTVATAASGGPISSKSIAVLPFVDMSEKHDQEYFSDGLSEELIDHLAHIPDLKVIARTSSFAFKGKNEDMRSIAAKLGVANLLEGSVRKAGGELRITAQLIRALDGVHLWSEIYDRKLTDIFKVQDEISTTVAKALNAALNTAPVADAKPAVKGTTNIEAYNLLLQGNYYYARSGEGDFPKAIGLYQQALKLDPHYAIAWAKLALTYAWQGNLGGMVGAEAQANGLAAVDRALVIDPNCAEAYYALGSILRLIAGDWLGAKSAYKKVVALDPHGEVGNYAQGYILDLSGAMSGRSGDFIDWANLRLERDPLDTDIMDDLAWHQLFAGQLDESVATGRRQLELNSVYEPAQARYGLTLLLMGKTADALAVAERESNSAFRLAVLACIYWTMSRRADSDAALNELEHKYSDLNEYQIAAVHAWRGETDAAFSWLDRVYQRRKGSLEYLKIEPALRDLHSDPRFDALLRKAKLTE